MQLKFKKQGFQTTAAKCVTDIFLGQPRQSAFDYIMDMGQQDMAQLIDMTGYANPRLNLSAQQMADNVHRIQMSQGLRPIDTLEGDATHPMFTIEMETGTGKTYTYIKTMYELNKLYGWSKFIIVVPSVAIREGVAQSLRTMRDHFMQEYGQPLQYFIYNSKNLPDIDKFASDSGMHVMIINTQAFNRSFDEGKKNNDSLIIFSRRDTFGSRRPIDVIAKTNPIMIIDEPQSVLGADKKNKTRQNLRVFNPLFSLLYSATHRKGDDLNMVYRLDAMDAYNQHLVKEIHVKGITQVGTTATNGYIYLEQVVMTTGDPVARLSFDTKTATGTKQVSRKVTQGTDLYALSGELEEYRDGYVVIDINAYDGTVRLMNGTVLHEGDALGRVSELALRRQQIRETIFSHFERERKLFHQGIKVLSLFFIDKVSNYRVYDSDGAHNGIFADMFEREYIDILQSLQLDFTDSEYARYLSQHPAHTVHNGYFSMDKGRMVDSKVERGTSDSADESAYDLIMRDKEKLLTYDGTPVRFIFSHSALKEGWDNPNVFQICTLKDSGSDVKKRQEVGRGMRLCVNIKGERQDAEVLGDAVFQTNILTVIASESYDQFARQLQTEMADTVADRPVVVTPTLFTGQQFATSDGAQVKITESLAVEIHEALIENGYVKKGKLTEKFFADKKAGSFSLDDPRLDTMAADIVRRLEQVFNPDAFRPKDARKKKMPVFREDLFKGKFQEIWRRINSRTYYRVDFSTDDLVKTAVKELDNNLHVTEIEFVVKSGTLGTIHSKEELESGVLMENEKVQRRRGAETVSKGIRYDLIGKLVEATGLTRRTIVRILQDISPATFLQYKSNPEEFIIKAGNIINDAKAIAVIQKIEYHRTNRTYDTDIFTHNNLTGTLGENAMESAKSLYDLVVVDSKGVEMDFAKKMETENDVVVYTKLPSGFYINTPMGKYNPDWAVVFDEHSVKHIYFIAETKGAQGVINLRGAEFGKIECARRHFAAISDSTLKYDVATTYQDMYNIVTK